MLGHDYHIAIAKLGKASVKDRNICDSIETSLRIGGDL